MKANAAVSMSKSLINNMMKLGSTLDQLNPCQQIRESCYRVSNEASFVRINQQAIEKFSQSIVEERLSTSYCQKEVLWDSDGWHYTDGGHRTCQYVFVMDALNFCFWPSPGLEYDTLAKSLKSVLVTDENAFAAENLAVITEVYLNYEYS